MNTYSITLKFENKIQTLNAIALSKNQSTTVVRNNEIDLDKTYLISVVHTELNSFLDLTGVIPFQLIFFDDNQNFVGASFSTGEPNHLFTIQTTAKHILLIPFKDKVNLIGLERIEI
nr:hypothetical protein [uncultured Flavobacterium sp.]